MMFPSSHNRSLFHDFKFLNHQHHHVRGDSSLVYFLQLKTFREVLLGITGKDFAIIAASKAAMRGATILKASDDKTKELNKYTLMAFSGEAGDTGMFCAGSFDLSGPLIHNSQYSLQNTSKPIFSFTR